MKDSFYRKSTSVAEPESWDAQPSASNRRVRDFIQARGSVQTGSGGGRRGLERPGGSGGAIALEVWVLFSARDRAPRSSLGFAEEVPAERAVFTRSPGFFGIIDGATTTQS